RLVLPVSSTICRWKMWKLCPTLVGSQASLSDYRTILLFREISRSLSLYGALGVIQKRSLLFRSRLRSPYCDRFAKQLYSSLRVVRDLTHSVHRARVRR